MRESGYCADLRLCEMLCVFPLCSARLSSVQLNPGAPGLPLQLPSEVGQRYLPPRSPRHTGVPPSTCHTALQLICYLSHQPRGIQTVLNTSAPVPGLGAHLHPRDLPPTSASLASKKAQTLRVVGVHLGEESFCSLQFLPHLLICKH